MACPEGQHFAMADDADCSSSQLTPEADYSSSQLTPEAELCQTLRQTSGQQEQLVPETLGLGLLGLCHVGGPVTSSGCHTGDRAPWDYAT